MWTKKVVLLLLLIPFLSACGSEGDDEPEIFDHTIPYDWQINKSIYFIENRDTSLVREWTDYMYNSTGADVQRAKEKFQAQSTDTYKYYFKAKRME
jgi:hypothetical protein